METPALPPQAGAPVVVATPLTSCVKGTWSCRWRIQGAHAVIPGGEAPGQGLHRPQLLFVLWLPELYQLPLEWALCSGEGHRHPLPMQTLC